MQDVRVKVGESPCISPEATDDAITCDPPEKPREIDGSGNSKVMVLNPCTITTV